MQCTLLIPHLWWSRGALGEAYRDLALTGLHTLVSRARHRAFAALGWEAWLCQAFEVERQRDWPVAPLTLAMDGGEPGNHYWLRADPVHLRAHRNQLVLADASAFALSQDETDALVASLNAHFGPDGLRFSAPRASRWYLRLETDPQIATVPLDETAGAVIDHCLPTGANALHWHRILNEAQMLLHGHAVNEAREARGEMPVNGVWFWGGGRRMTVRGRHFSKLIGDEPLALALAAHADTASTPARPGTKPWLAREDADAAAACALVVLDALIAPARRGDLEAWRRALEALDAEWIEPLLASLRQGHIGEIALVAPGTDACHRFELRRADLLRFWRTRRSLEHWLPAATT